jgi:hypothetical protein
VWKQILLRKPDAAKLSYRLAEMVTDRTDG